MKRSKTSAGWMQEHVSDPYVKRAQSDSYRSRAVYKLLEVDAEVGLLRPGMRVVDLGCAPGGWAQAVAPRIGASGVLIGVDLLPVAPVEGLAFIQGDFREDGVLKALEERLGGKRVDLVLSDLAPNLSGIASIDQPREAVLAELAMSFAADWLRPGGRLFMKTFHGEAFDTARRLAKDIFARVEVKKPKASRDRSSEVFVLCRDKRD